MSKLITCKTCGAEVAKSAKTCPSCGARLKKKHILLGIIIAIIALIIIISVAAGGNDTPKKVGEVDSSATANDVAEQTVFGVGDIVELNGIKVTLLNVEESAGSEYNKPADGNTFIICEFLIENGSNADIGISSLMCFEAYHDDFACNLSLEAELEKSNKNTLDGTVAAGKKFNGIIGYEIPNDWKEFEIKFTPDFWSSKDISFVIKNK